MKKKLIATLVAGVVLSTGIIGLTACDGGLSVPKGEAVANEAAWKTAFARTDDLTNYTCEGSATMTSSIQGTVATTDSSGATINEKHNYTIKNTISALYAFDIDNDKVYVENGYTTEKRGSVLGKECDESSSSIGKCYYELRAEEENKKTYWQAVYTKTDSKSLESEDSTENLWQAIKVNYIYDNEFIKISNTAFYANEDSETISKLSELYEAFTYADGLYTATFYKKIEFDGIAEDKVSCAVTVSIKDGYIMGLQLKVDAKNVLYQKNAYDIEYTYKDEEIVVYSNIKSTDVSKKANKDIKKAIEKAKANEENS